MRSKCFCSVLVNRARSVLSVPQLDCDTSKNGTDPEFLDQSTVLKQMKLIHHGGYNEAERDSYKEIIFSNTVQSMRAILEAMPALDIYLSPQSDARRTVILSLPVQIEGDTMPRDVADAIRGLWRDPGVREAVRRAREFQLNDSAT